MNQLQALAVNEGYRWKKKLFLLRLGPGGDVPCLAANQSQIGDAQSMRDLKSIPVPAFDHVTL
jgi:hypothetical protein